MRSAHSFSRLRFARLRLAIGSVTALAVAASVLTWSQISAREKVTAGEDLTAQVSLKQSDSLLGSERTGWFVNMSLTNTSAETLQGPVLLVVEDTGIPMLVVSEPDGYLDSGEPYVTLVPPGGTLKSDKSTKSQKLNFNSQEKLRTQERRAFELKWKVVRGEVQDVPDQVVTRRGNGPAGFPGAGASAGGSSTGQTAGNTPQKLTPEPATEPLPKDEENGGANNPPADNALDKEVERVMAIQDRFTAQFLSRPGVVGTGTALDDDGKPGIRVYVERAGIRKDLPETYEGVNVLTRVTGKIRMFAPPPQDKKGQAGQPNSRDTDLPPGCVNNPQVFFERPVPIGVSAINPRSGCAAGTLGCRVKNSAGALFALSNNHVFADENAGLVGDIILQPSPGDQPVICDVPPTDSVGTLFDFEPIVFDTIAASAKNEIDSAIIAITPDMVGNSTPCSGYGLPNSKTSVAVLGMKVQKYGRTTSWRTSSVSALNVTVTVAYGNGPATFVDQIEFTNPDPFGLSLGAPGDSGSLIVTNPNKNPVALLFAGSALVTLGNPIDKVLTRFDVTIDGAPSND